MVIALVFVIFKAITCREALFVVGLLHSICRVSIAIALIHLSCFFIAHQSVKTASNP